MKYVPATAAAFALLLVCGGGMWLSKGANTEWGLYLVAGLLIVGNTLMPKGDTEEKKEERIRPEPH
jgi:hypothetical protein